MATSEECRLIASWILERMERDQDERREWHAEAMAQNADATAAHHKRVSGMFWMLALRPVIELAILITLIIKF